MKFILLSIKTKMLVLLAMLLFYGVNHARNIYVATNGNDSNSGNFNNPFRTIQRAANIVNPGDQVFVRAGTYNGNNGFARNLRRADGSRVTNIRETAVTLRRSGTPSQFIIFQPDPSARGRVNIDGGFFVLGASNITIQGFRIRNAFRGINVEGPAQNIFILNNITNNTFESGIAVWGVRFGNDPRVNYRGTRIRGRAGIRNLTIRGNTVDNACNGGFNECITVANGIVNFTIANNTVRNGRDGRHGGEGIDLKEGVRNGSISGNRVFNLQRRGIYLDPAGLPRPNAAFNNPIPVIEDVNIFNNDVHDNSRSTGAFASDADGIALASEGVGFIRRVRIFNNKLYRNQDDGIQFNLHPNAARPSSDQSVLRGTVRDITVVHNTIFNNRRNGITLGDNTNRRLIIENNIAFNNRNGNLVAVSFRRGDGFLVQGNIRQATGQSPQNIRSNTNLMDGTNPRFVNAGNANFNLRSNSRAINRGRIFNFASRDFSNRGRIGRPDFGALEFRNNSSKITETITPKSSNNAIVYPNPLNSTEQLHLEINTSTANSNLEISISNISGVRIFQTEEVIEKEGVSILSFDFSKLNNPSSGVYLMTIKSNSLTKNIRLVIE